ncbi:MAG: photosynthetic complex putative assembly protein PuhB [Rhodovarius sp.]|nr:photosynthetic complex putative assembly protein PuhB [Rhodovarius sp.]
MSATETTAPRQPRHVHLSPRIPEHDHEPIPGLPQRLPEGESLLWQGRPQWRGLAVRAMGLKPLAIYFALLIAAQIAWGLADGDPPGAILFGSVLLLLLGGGVVGLLAGIGWLAARATLYTITNRRVVMRAGIALPMTINIPFAVIESLARRVHADGTEDLLIRIMRPHRASWIALWPHVRMRSLLQPEPMLRALPQEAGAGLILARALAQAAGQPPPALSGAVPPAAPADAVLAA